MARLLLILLLGVSSLSKPVYADAQMLRKLLNDNLNGAGYSVHLIDGDTSASLVRGDAAPGETLLTPAHMFRIASTTKTYVAASVLRLMEQGRLDLSDPAEGLISQDLNEVLTGDGYDTRAITVKQLLSHTAGLYDHAQDSRYGERIKADPEHVWTREEQVEAMAAWGDPVGAPAEKFVYSDTGYLLLGDIIERATGRALPLAVRDLLRLEVHGLSDTVWERGDAWTPPSGQRAHQFLAGDDTHSWEPSNDLFGGGGLVATPSDVAHFYDFLMGGKIFDRPETLALMLSAEGLPEDSPYRLGVFVQDHDGGRVYDHAGFWGTGVFHDVGTGITVACAALEQEDFKILVEVITSFLEKQRP